MTDILIIGGGIIGMLSARQLASAGASVTLLESGELAQESSWAGGGIISPLYPWRFADSVTRLAQWSQKHYAGLTSELANATGIDPEYQVSGLLIEAEPEAAQALQWATRFGYRMNSVNSTDISRIEPARRIPPDSALWMPDVAQVRNPRLVKALATSLHSQIRIKTGCKVLKIHYDAHRQRVTGVSTNNDVFHADKVVVCAGAWSGQLFRDLPQVPQIHPMRGQMLLFRSEPGVIQRMMLEQDRYVIPRRDGRILFGSTTEDVGFDKHTTATAREELSRIAVSRFPVLADYPIEHHWAGLRPASPAGIPYIAQHPEITGLFINAGHFRNGVVLAPASARLLADLILQRPPILDPAPYAIEASR